jgi:hypothetical protein
MKLSDMQKARLFIILLCGVAGLIWVMTYRTKLEDQDYLNRLAWGNPQPATSANNSNVWQVYQMLSNEVNTPKLVNTNDPFEQPGWATKMTNATKGTIP